MNVIVSTYGCGSDLQSELSVLLSENPEADLKRFLINHLSQENLLDEYNSLEDCYDKDDFLNEHDIDYSENNHLSVNLNDGDWIRYDVVKAIDAKTSEECKNLSWN